MMSKERPTTVATTLHRLRTYRRYLHTQPQTGWGRDAARNGNLELTAIAGASA